MRNWRMSTPENMVLRILSEQRFAQYLPPEDVANVQEALSISRDPIVRRYAHMLDPQWPTAVTVVQNIPTSGHTFEHHALDRFDLGMFDPEKIVKAYVGAKKKSKQVMKLMANAEKRMVGRVLSPEMILRCRAIGVDIETLTLTDKPAVCPSCAFRSRAIAELAAEWMTVRFLQAVQRGFDREVAIPCAGGEIKIIYLSGKGGYTMTAPICAMGFDIMAGVIGFAPNQPFGAVSGTIAALVPKLGKSPKKDAYLQLLLYVAESLTGPIALNTGWIKAIFIERTGQFGIFSMYPTPPE